MWVGPGTEQEFSQVRSQCVRDTGGELLVTGRRELGRIGTGRSGEPDPTLFSEYQAKQTPLDVSQYKRLRFIQCMEDKGYRLEPVVVGDGVAVREENGVGGNSSWAKEGQK